MFTVSLDGMLHLGTKRESAGGVKQSFAPFSCSKTLTMRQLLQQTGQSQSRGSPDFSVNTIILREWLLNDRAFRDAMPGVPKSFPSVWAQSK
jgi:hypothetical protein